ncbi:MAG: RNA polymerase sigma factor [Candidatus Zixiibacteriota bacterium]|nr:MAG: RNA polymerase sigma factor [candidate division Zixibacteria bacterium]
MKESSIAALYKYSCGGDQVSEDRLFERLSERFREFVRHRIWDEHDAEEIVQDALMVIYKSYKDITFTTSFTAWAYKVLDNRILAYIKAKKREAGRPVQRGLTDGIVATAIECEDSELRRRLLECLKKTAEANTRYARVLNLHYQGYSTGEICDRLILTRNSFYILLSRARSVLRACLKKGEA